MTAPMAYTTGCPLCLKWGPPTICYTCKQVKSRVLREVAEKICKRYENDSGGERYPEDIAEEIALFIYEEMIND